MSYKVLNTSLHGVLMPYMMVKKNCGFISNYFCMVHQCSVHMDSHTHARTHASTHTNTRPHARTHARTHTHTHTHGHTTTNAMDENVCAAFCLIKRARLRPLDTSWQLIWSIVPTDTPWHHGDWYSTHCLQRRAHLTNVLDSNLWPLKWRSRMLTIWMKISSQRYLVNVHM